MPAWEEHLLVPDHVGQEGAVAERGLADGVVGEGIETVVEGPVVEDDVHVLGKPVDDSIDLRERRAALEGHGMRVGHGEQGLQHPADPVSFSRMTAERPEWAARVRRMSARKRPVDRASGAMLREAGAGERLASRQLANSGSNGFRGGNDLALPCPKTQGHFGQVSSGDVGPRLVGSVPGGIVDLDPRGGREARGRRGRRGGHGSSKAASSDVRRSSMSGSRSEKGRKPNRA